MIARKMKKNNNTYSQQNPLIGSKAGFEDAIITRHQNEFESVAMDIYDFAEVGYQEHESSDLLIKSLKSHGFDVTSSVANIYPLVAEYGSGYPTIAILENTMLFQVFLSPHRHTGEPGNNIHAGHACGHHLFGAGSAWAAVAIKDWLRENKIKGTIRFYGTPAEEGGSGKFTWLDPDSSMMWILFFIGILEV